MRTRLAVAFGALLFMLLGAPTAMAHAVAGPASLAAAEEPAITGILRGPDREPIEGVTLTVTDAGSATTDAKGEWRIEVPGPGTYEVTLDTSTLPDGLQTRDKGGETLPAVQVRAGRDSTVIFPLIPQGEQQESGTPSGTDDADSTESDTSAGTTAGDGGSDFTGRFLQLVVEGIKYGTIIAITSVGLSLVFGTTGLINFAHGELVALGAIAAFFFSAGVFDLPLVLAALVAIVIGGGAGAALERGLWRPLRLRGTGLIQMFIISIGVSLFLRHLLLIFYGGRRQQYDQYALQSEIDLGPVSITPRDLTVTVVAIVVIIGVGLMLQRTRMGKAMRAVSDNRDLAESSGIDVNRVVLFVWILGGGLAALGGVFYGLTTAIYWDMGFNLLLLMFAGVILGGLGSAFGAVVGSLVVGLVAQLSTLWFPTELQNAWALLVLIIVLLVRPQGILGRAERVG
ncbi:carboxypeptidase regulatory-like domain-containing protein [Janibacter cremeus]|uniref:branched-chain amino acid ABC transporter permease n=1 Tax=Janibacter cremeus TaxID=1285192 RepID=UPI0023F8D254|nr:carboxypeptidase regulatory-like domain-containing protein [Janibacter cremeus]WEV79054.1 carboxypeptidase regulatory-like domain-containing protein [Janibacter cremeus]